MEHITSLRVQSAHIAIWVLSLYNKEWRNLVVMFLQSPRLPNGPTGRTTMNYSMS